MEQAQVVAAQVVFVARGFSAHAGSIAPRAFAVRVLNARRIPSTRSRPGR
jgi:hypothetical protein